MATVSEAARNAAIDAIVALLETGTARLRPTMLAADSGVTAIFFVFFAQTSPVSPTFTAASGGVATKVLLPASFTAINTTRATLARWHLLNQDDALVITGTWGGPGSGADIELGDLDHLNTLIGNVITLDTFTLEMV